ncbi:MAG: hypothetical protein HY720_31580 [Planctomycetes bacterium]|nr:hypothetical protein [Planctomycetota bacterium]
MRTGLPFLLLAVLLAPAILVPRSMAAESDDLLDEISLLNLLRGLELTRDQQARLLDLARRASDLRAEHRARQDAVRTEWARDLSHLRQALLSAEEHPDTSLEERVVAQEMRIYEIDGELTSRLQPLAAELALLLSPAQQAVVRTFQPCLIPPPSLRDPVRAGQAASGQPELDGALHDLDLLRALPESAFAALGRPLAEARLPEWSPLEGG